MEIRIRTVGGIVNLIVTGQRRTISPLYFTRTMIFYHNWKKLMDAWSAHQRCLPYAPTTFALQKQAIFYLKHELCYN
jgi:hypothetical protein